MTSVYENGFGFNYMFTYQANNTLKDHKTEESKKKGSEKENEETTSFSFVLNNKMKTFA